MPVAVTSLLAPTVRAMSFGSLVTGVAAGSAMVALSVSPIVNDPRLGVLIAMILTGSAAAFAHDDTAAATLAPSPTALPRRHGFRLLIAAMVVSIGWGIDLIMLRPTNGGGRLATDGTVAVAAIAASAVAAAMIAAGRGAHTRGGAEGATAAAVMVIVFEMLAMRWSDVVPSISNGQSAGRGWLVVFAAAGAVIVWYSRDPARATRASRR